MAKLIAPLLSEQAAGSVGATTYLRRGRDTYARSRIEPSTQYSSRQVATRALTHLAQTYWSALTDSQRELWHLYAPSIEPTDWNNRPKGWTGYHAYLHLMSAVLRYGKDPLSTPPAIYRPGRLLSPVSSFDELGILLTWGSMSDPTGHERYLELFYNGPHSPGRYPPLTQKTYATYAPVQESFARLYPEDVGYYTLSFQLVDSITGFRGPWEQQRLNFNP